LITKLISEIAQKITYIPGFSNTARYLWIPIGSLKLRMSYRNACQKGKVYLHLGSGPVNIDGWLNTDITPFHPYLDATQDLPIKDNSVSFIFGEHFIEYIPRKALFSLLRECYRVLKPNGALRITIVDIEALARAYLNDPERVRLLNERNQQCGYKYCSFPIDILNKTFFEDYQTCEYDAQTLRRLFAEAGFQNISCYQVGESPHAALSGIEKHDKGSILDNFMCATEGTK
jgi:predicted SAM-dependent methyltransferase